MANDNPAEGRIRSAQLQAVQDMLPAIMLANILCSGILVVLFHRDFPAVLFPWFALVSSISVVRLLPLLRGQQRPVPSWVSERAMARTTRQAVVMAVCFISVPAWLLTHASAASFTVVICLITGMLWAGGLVLATLPTAATAYVGIVAGATMIALLTTDTGSNLLLSILFLAGAFTVLRTVNRQHRIFVTGQRQRIDLEKQTELVGLLLKDYEEQTSDWLWETDEALTYRNVSERFSNALRRPRASIEGCVFGQLLVDTASGENDDARSRLRAYAHAREAFRDHVVPFSIDGETRWWSLSGRPMHDERGAFTGYRGVCSDISDAKRAETRIAYLAHHDALTDLPNRTLFAQALDRALGALENAPAAILSLDLDGFKAVNDKYGHPVGDALLVEVTKRLRAAVHGTDMVARFGGDEFVVLHLGFAAVGEVEALARRFIESLSQPFFISNEEVSVGVSIGIAFAGNDGRNSEDLLKNVDAALYRAKAEGRATFRFFSPEMDRRQQERQALVQDLRTALSRNQFRLHYQPFVTAKTGVASGYEALLRWEHPQRGLIPPLEFIPLAEESGLITAIGAWVIREACREAAQWPADQRVSVNISPVQFRGAELPLTILSALKDSGLPPSRLEVEVTEAVLIDDAATALRILGEIRALGVKLALDDFGTGYSSLSYLREFPFDKIKIDRSFVSDLASRRDNQVIVQAICDMASGLGMTITAEGVETCEQAESLRRTGCEELQGYLYGRPLPPEDRTQGQRTTPEAA